MRAICTCLRLFCVGLLALGPVHARAAGDGIQACPDAAFHVVGVEVSANAESGSEARVLATRQASDKAWSRLTGRLLLDGEQIKKASGADAGPDLTLDDLVDHVRVIDETVLSKRYIATFDYCFDRDKTRRYFAGLGVRHAELVSAPMLVLPVWDGGGQPRIWRRPNLWIDAWEEVLGDRNGLVTLRLPESLAIERAVSPADVLDRKRDTLSRAARIEDAEKIIVTVVTPSVEGDTMTVSVSAGLYNRDGALESRFYKLDSLSFPVESTAERMQWLAGQIENGIESVWRGVNAVTLVEAALTVPLRVPAADIGEWRDLVDRLRSLPPVERVRVMQLAPGGGIVRVELSTSMQSFVYALEAEGLAIEQGAGKDGETTPTLVPRRG